MLRGNRKGKVGISSKMVTSGFIWRDKPKEISTDIDFKKKEIMVLLGFYSICLQYHRKIEIINVSL